MLSPPRLGGSLSRLLNFTFKPVDRKAGGGGSISGLQLRKRIHITYLMQLSFRLFVCLFKMF